jgi:arylsulfatase
MRGRKITLWDGGHRVPCFIRWPAGKLGEPRDINELTQIQDLLPTLIDLCGLKAPKEPQFDGTSLAGLLRGSENKLPDRMLVVQFSRMDHQVPVKGDASVLWKNWRLMNGTDLYDIAADPGHEHNLAEKHPEVFRKMQGHYDRWWSDIEPRVNQLTDLTIGSDAEPVTMLSPADWQDVFLDQQRQVRDATARSGPWGLEVARDGEYVFELRRYPREANLALTAEAPPFKGVDGRLPPGKALAIAQAKLRVGELEKTRQLKPEDKFARFVMPLKKGKVTAQTWFYDESGKELCGAYYVYVQRQ